MSKQMINRLLLIASAGLLIATVIFLGISIFDGSKDTGMLSWALFCLLLSNLFNLIRSHNKEKNE